MRVDEAGHHDLAARVDHVGIAGGQVGADGEDLLALDQHVAAHEVDVADLGGASIDMIGAAANQIAPAGPAAVARRTVVVIARAPGAARTG